MVVMNNYIRNIYMGVTVIKSINSLIVLPFLLTKDPLVFSVEIICTYCIVMTCFLLRKIERGSRVADMNVLADMSKAMELVKSKTITTHTMCSWR